MNYDKLYNRILRKNTIETIKKKEIFIGKHKKKL